MNAYEDGYCFSVMFSSWDSYSGKQISSGLSWKSFNELPVIAEVVRLFVFVREVMYMMSLLWMLVTRQPAKAFSHSTEEILRLM